MRHSQKEISNKCTTLPLSPMFLQMELKVVEFLFVCFCADDGDGKVGLVSHAK